MTKTIRIDLTHDEALVLFERLSQLDKTKPLPFADHAEELVFWRIHGQLEKVLVEPFDPKYRNLVTEAKIRVTREE